MKDTNDPVDELLRALRPSSAPEELRPRTLGRALRSWDEAPVGNLWQRLWESGPLRLAWATTVIALIAANLGLPARGRQATAGAGAATAMAPGELRDVVELPRVRLSYVGVEAAPQAPPAPNPAPAAPGHGKETRS
jgi:hypothetical protein